MFSTSLQLSQNTMTQIPPGIYRINVAGGIDPARLTRTGEHVTILPPGAQPDPEQEVIHRFGDELDCLSLTSHFSGELPLVKMATSSSRAPSISDHPLTLLTKAIPRNLRRSTRSCTKFPNSLRTNGGSELRLDVVPCQSTVLSFSRRWSS
jgi:hypothetical protein